MDDRGPVPGFKVVVYGPPCTKRTHGCYVLTRNEPLGGLWKQVANNTLVNPYVDVKILRNTQHFGGSGLELWDLSSAKPDMDTLVGDYMLGASVVVIAVPEQDDEETTQDLVRAYQQGACNTGIVPNVPMPTLIIARTDTHDDVAQNLCHAFVTV